MNKKYNDYTYQAPTGSRILLHADPVTGALNNAPLSEIAGGNYQSLRTSLSDISNTTTSVENIDQYSIPANTLITNGDRLIMKALVELTGGGSANSIGYYFTANTGSILSSSSNMTVRWEMEIMKISSSVARYSVTALTSFGNNGVGIFERTSLSFASSILVSLYVTGNAIGSITQKYACIDLFKV